MGYVTDGIPQRRVDRANRVFDLYELVALQIGPLLEGAITGQRLSLLPVTLADFERITRTRGDACRQRWKTMKDVLAVNGLRLELLEPEPEPGEPRTSTRTSTRTTVDFDVRALARFVRAEIKDAGRVLEEHHARFGHGRRLAAPAGV